MLVEIEGKLYATACSGTPDGKTPRGHRLRVKKILGDSNDTVIISPWLTPEILSQEYPGIETIGSDGTCPDCWPKDEVSVAHPDLEFYEMANMPYKKG